MKKIIRTVEIPIKSNCKLFLSKIDYQDAFRVKISDQKLTIEELYLNVFANPPKWIAFLMNLRDNVVGIFGLKTTNVSQIKSKKLIKIGLKVGLFKIYDISNTEIIAGEDDSHLDFRVSILKYNKYLTISTLVKYNNIFGKLYMKIVIPFHKIIVKAMILNAKKNNRI